MCVALTVIPVYDGFVFIFINLYSTSIVKIKLWICVTPDYHVRSMPIKIIVILFVFFRLVNFANQGNPKVLKNTASVKVIIAMKYLG